MNLAEIRKKARQEKATESTGHGAVRTDDETAFVEEPAAAPQSVSPDIYERLFEDTMIDPGVSAATPDTPVKGESTYSEETTGDVAAAFDPLSILLAGRRSAGTVADMLDTSSSASPESNEELLKYLRFRVDDEDYGVSLLEIREIIKPRAITDVPRMPAFVAGVLSLRGTIIPVFDLRLRLGLVAGESSGRERIIIAKKQEGSCGLLVDEVFQVISLNASAIGKAPTVLDGVDREFVKGIGHHGERMLILLDLEKIMDVTLR